MKLRFLQLNIEGGRFLDAVIRYVKEYEIDIIHLQEVSGGAWGNGADVFTAFKDALDFQGELSPNFGLKGDQQSFFGNATLYRSRFKKCTSEVVWMQNYREYETTDTKPFEQVPRNLLAVEFQIGSVSLTTVNTHLVWGPTSVDSEFKRNQHTILFDYIRAAKAPFILSGDFNVEPNSWIVQQLNTVSRDLAKEAGYPNTLNPDTHYAKHLFPAGTAVDYVFTSHDIGVRSVKLIEKPDLSDHLGYFAEFDIPVNR